MNPTSFKYGIRLPQATEDNTKLKLVAIDDDGNIQAYITEIPASMLPPIAITSVILAAETSISDFATNSGSYTFEQGDVIILANGNGSYYMYKGGTKTNVSSYNEITTSEVEWSQIVNTPISLSGYGITDAYTKTESNTRYANLTGDTFTGPVIATSFSGDGINITNVDAEKLTKYNLGTDSFTETITDLNDNTLLSGIYRFKATATGNPISSSGVLYHMNTGVDGYISQIAYFINSQDINRMFIRHYRFPFSTWSTFQEIIHTGNISDYSELPTGFSDEGAFTPTLTATGASYSIGFSDCYYIRNGNQVTVTIDLRNINTSGTPSSSLKINNLPFTSVSTSSGSIGRITNHGENFYEIFSILTSSSNSVFFNKKTSLTGDTNIIFSPIFTAGDLYMSITYITNVYTP